MNKPPIIPVRVRNPLKDFNDLGLGHLSIACIFEGSVATPYPMIICPRYSTLDYLKEHPDNFAYICSDLSIVSLSLR